ncbi:MAG: sigma 54-interacting transcriptional regulator [Planctomycetaceae bacterium]|nr:sigma 54-interacting transcriptional regulator [Planctomycetaceae bacterium]
MTGRRPTTPRSLVWIRDSSTPLFVLNHRRQVASFNQGCERITGWAAEHVLGRRVEAVTEDDPESVAAVLAALMPPVECWQGRACQLPILIPERGHGATSRVVQFWPIRDSEGAVHMILGIVDETAPAVARTIPTLAQTMHAELAALRLELRSRYGLGALVGRSPAMQRACEQVRLAQGATSTVLLVGESGAGKEHLARTIHQAGPQSRRVFVRLDCRLTPALEIKRALRLASESATGRSADPDLQPGTLYFADIDVAPADVHDRLLEWFAAGSDDVRIMASTTSDLGPLVEQGRFPEPLLYRLSTQTILLPSLRDRPEDLRPLAQFFLEERNRAADRQVSGFSEDAWQQLAHYRWPGNLDELAAVIQEARDACPDDLIQPDHLPFRFRTGVDAQRLGPPPRRAVQPLDQVLEHTERELIEAAVADARGNMTLAAERLGINRARLYRRMEQLGIGGR